MAGDPLDYEAILDRQFRGVVRIALGEVAERGLPGEHHFYITFKTGAPGVAIPDHLRARYPRDMTIVLQNQYWNLEVGDAHFSVMLSFGGRQEKLHIPLASLTSFADPAANFALQFEPAEGAEAAEDADAVADENAGETRPDIEPKVLKLPGARNAEGKRDSATVVPLDSFRKKQ